MKTNKEMLSSILKTTQMGQIGIRSVQSYAVSAELQKALDSQLREYDTVESEAQALAIERGWELSELNSGLRAMSEMMCRARLMGGQKDSKIAGMMIQGNTRGIITGLKNFHQLRQQDPAVAALSDKLLETEKNNVRQMEPFL